MCTPYHLTICQKKTCCLYGRIRFYSCHDNLKTPAITSEFLTNDLLWFQSSVQGQVLTDPNPGSAPLAKPAHPPSCGVHSAVFMRFLFLTSHIFAPHLSVLCFPFPISHCFSIHWLSILKTPKVAVVSGGSSSCAHAVTLGHRPRVYGWSQNTQVSQGPGGKD